MQDSGGWTGAKGGGLTRVAKHRKMGYKLAFISHLYFMSFGPGSWLLVLFLAAG